MKVFRTWEELGLMIAETLNMPKGKYKARYKADNTGVEIKFDLRNKK